MTEKTVKVSIAINLNDVQAGEWKKEISVEQIDMEIKQLMMEAGSGVLGQALETVDEGIRREISTKWENVGREERTLITIMGKVKYKRRVYVDEKGKRHKPLDEKLGLPKYQRETNAVCMLGAYLASQNSYRDAAEELSYLVEEPITHSKIQRVVWGVGNSLADHERATLEQWDEEAEELIEERELYGESDGVMIRLQREAKRKTEVRVGIMYTGKKVIGKGRRRLENKVWLTRIGVDGKEWREALQHLAYRTYGMEQVKQMIVGGDGASWVKHSFDWLWVKRQTFVLDRFHLYRAGKRALQGDGIRMINQICEHGIESVEAELAAIIHTARGKRKERLKKFWNYLQSNRDGLQDLEYRKGEWQSKSLGAIEGNVDKLVARRMKGHGRSWRIPGARAMLALCSHRQALRNCAYSLGLFKKLIVSTKSNKSKPAQADWMQVNMPIFSSSFRETPWVKDLRNKIRTKRVLSMDYF